LNAFIGLAVIASGYSIRENAHRCFQHAGGAESFRRVRKDFRATLSADSDDRDHCCFSPQSFWKPESVNIG
jgi:hypothetical protein